MNRIIHGDCIEEMNRLPDNSARLVIADPPYFKVLLAEDWDNSWRDEAAYLAWTMQWMEAAMRVLVPGGLLYCFGQPAKREQAMLHLMSQAARRFEFH